MQLSDFDVPFDPSLVADRPVEPRDQARLLVLPRTAGPCTHRRIADLPVLLDPGDVLVVNETKVIPARVLGRRRDTGKPVDLVFVRERQDGLWEVLLKGDVKPGQVLDFGRALSAEVVSRDAGHTMVRVRSPRPLREVLRHEGLMPLPPYIKRKPVSEDRRWYQPIFGRVEGAIAAPTASLHFSESLLVALRDRRILLATVTLHVGPATFLPVRTPQVEDHTMLPEWTEVGRATAEAVNRARTEGRRVVAVGTTVVRALESAVGEDGTVRGYTGETDLFILPGFHFRAVTGLLTNFHLPRTTLIMLVSAFAGLERVRPVYAEAVHQRYRLYSYGDAMLIV
ncbi:MAG: tRNA preQ1(34) S-adenosylmethionine ribosyltransferase-isomerase QueA [Nitrospirales bacterium]